MNLIEKGYRKNFNLQNPTVGIQNIINHTLFISIALVMHM